MIRAIVHSGNNDSYYLLFTAIIIYAIMVFSPFFFLKKSDSLPTLDWAPGYIAGDAKIRIAKVIPFAPNKLKSPVIKQAFIKTINGNNNQSFKSY